MTIEELNQLAADVEARKVTARAAIAQLIAAGHDQDEATELVFCVLGGSDLIVIGEDGVERYEESGRTVAEVEADMAR